MKKRILLLISCVCVGISAVAQGQENVPVTGVTLNEDTLKANLGDIGNILTAEITPHNATNNDVSWITEDDNVATVDNGYVHFTGVGETNIIVETQDGSFKDTCVVQVVAIPVTGVTLNQDTLKANLGDPGTILLATTIPINATNRTISWITENNNVATVDNSGGVYFTGVGETNIIVETQDGSFKDTCVVQVVAIPIEVEGISLNIDTLKKSVGDAAVTLIATIEPENATDEIKWRSTVETVATVSNAGIVNFVGEGETYIIVETQDEKFRDTCVVQVASIPIEVEGISLNIDTLKKSVGDAAVTLIATIEPEDATNKNVTWKSTVETVATVSNAGVVNFVGEGETYIIVKTQDGEFKDSCVVKVSEAKIPVTGVQLSKDSISIIEGDTLRLTVTILPNNASNKNVTWTSKDATIASIANGLVTAKKAGKTSVIVTSEDGSKRDTCIVNVREKVVFVDPETATGRNGSFSLSLNTPDNETLTGSFTIKFPTGIILDVTNTKLVGTFDATSTLSVNAEGNNTWKIEIKEKGLRNTLRAVSNKKIMDIAYTIDKSVVNGTYDIAITNANFKSSNDTEIKEEQMNIKLKVNIDDTSVDLIESEKAYVYTADNRLYIQSVQAETIYIYSFNGSLLYTKEKAAGEIVFDLNIQEPIIIVKGSSGWTQKVTK